MKLTLDYIEKDLASCVENVLSQSNLIYSESKSDSYRSQIKLWLTKLDSYIEYVDNLDFRNSTTKLRIIQIQNIHEQLENILTPGSHPILLFQKQSQPRISYQPDCLGDSLCALGTSFVH